MTIPEQQYFALLQSALWDKPVPHEMEIDWASVVRIAKHHGNIVLVADAASRLPENQQPSPELLAKMKNAMRGNLVNQLELKRILVMVVTAMRQQGIEPVLLKGFGIAMLYPNPNLRQFGDLDLFVGLNRFHDACAIVRDLPGSHSWCMEVDAGRHYNVDFGEHPVETHRVSADVVDAEEREFYATIEQDGLVEHTQHVDYEGYALTLPSPEFAVFFTFYHAWHHFMTTGVGWRQLSDFAMTLHSYLGSQAVKSESFDVEKLRSWLTTMHVMEPWQAFGWLLVECLGLPKAEMPFYSVSCRRRAQKLYTRVMAEGNFRRPNRFKYHKRKGRLAKKIHSLIVVFVEYFQLAAVFPKQARRELYARMKVAFSKNFQKK